MLERIIGQALRTPWAITPEYGAIVQDVLIARSKGIRFSAEEIKARIEAQRVAVVPRASMFDDDDDEPPQLYGTVPLVASSGSRGGDGVLAVIGVHGVLCNRSFEASSGCTSAEYVSAAAARADDDPNVRAVLFDHSSPGGVVSGIPELGKQIRGMQKPTIGFVNALSASASYWLLAQCNEIVMRESGQVGSIGVYCCCEDWSEYLAKEGIKINAISAGEYKLEGAPWEPLSDEARAFIQADVDDCYGKFLAAVAQGRGVTVSVVKKKYGQGRCLSSAQALEAGMVDKIGEIDVAIGRANALARAKGKQASVTVGTSSSTHSAVVITNITAHDNTVSVGIFDVDGDAATTKAETAAASGCPVCMESCPCYSTPKMQCNPEGCDKCADDCPCSAATSAQAKAEKDARQSQADRDRVAIALA